MRLKFGEPCPECGTEIVRITRETLNGLPDYSVERFNTISKAQKNGKRKFIPVCPYCDAYSLGIEGGFEAPFILKDGRVTNIFEIGDPLWHGEKPFRSEEFKTMKTERETEIADDAKTSAKIIQFPKYTPPEIDWDEVEEIRTSRYPDLPIEVIDVFQKMMASKPNSKNVVNENYYWEIHSYSDDIYPPDPIPIIPGKASTIWLMDLLDRFGGTVDYGGLNCTVERNEIRYPVFSIQRVSEEQHSGMDDCLKDYDFYVENSYWRVFSKELREYNIVVLFARDLSDETRIFQGMFDDDTFQVLKDRLLEGKQAWDEILLIG